VVAYPSVGVDCFISILYSHSILFDFPLLSFALYCAARSRHGREFLDWGWEGEMDGTDGVED